MRYYFGNDNKSSLYPNVYITTNSHDTIDVLPRIHYIVLIMMGGLATLRLLLFHQPVIVVMNLPVNLGVVGGKLTMPALSFHSDEDNLVN